MHVAEHTAEELIMAYMFAASQSCVHLQRLDWRFDEEIWRSTLRLNGKACGMQVRTRAILGSRNEVASASIPASLFAATDDAAAVSRSPSSILSSIASSSSIDWPTEVI
eukprot:CCRYP_001248-RF/>CCRYP_001248-RF protein AED:0.48 eAED:1.00 QI:0/0/0/1/0/0/3/0/108